MGNFEKQLMHRIHHYMVLNGRRPSKILAWRDAYAHIRSDWQNVAVQTAPLRLIWKGYEVLRVDAPGYDVHLLGDSDICIDEDW